MLIPYSYLATSYVVLSLNNSVACVQRPPVLNFPCLFLTLLVSKFPFSLILHHFLQNHTTKTHYLVSSSPVWQSSNILQRVQRIKFPFTEFKNLRVLNSGNASYYLVQNILPSHPLPTNAQMITFICCFVRVSHLVSNVSGNRVLMRVLRRYRRTETTAEFGAS